MPTVAIAVPRVAQRNANAARQSWIETEDGTRVYLTWAPQEVRKSGAGATFAVLSRPGRRPVTVMTGKGLPSLSFVALIGSVDRQRSIEDTIVKLEEIAAAGAPVKYVYGGLEAGTWLIETLEIASKDRTELGQVSRAEVAFTLITSNPTSKPGTGGGGGGSDGWRIHIWKKGDTLYKLAKRYLGNGKRWREIAKANKIKNPKKIKVGTRLRIPPR